MPWKNWPKLSAWAFNALLFFISSGYSHFSNAQFVQQHTVDPTSDQVALRSSAKITAVAIIDTEATAPSRSVIVDGNKYELELDIHAPRPTYFLSLPSPANSLAISEVASRMEVYTIHSGSAPDLSQFERNESECTEVNAVPQSEWRAGLPDPSPNPSLHTVTHHIVHHTAGSNSSTNYTQVVRDIYLLHTQVNGWADIGYNFVIAQDGTLYEGRDPGEGRSEFDVRGAHFCGKNTGTFGVALLGNYETAQLTDESRTTLVNLLAFSLSSLEIDPLSTATHRGVNLRAISGHRDGCATLCPGENVYNLLPEIRMEVQDQIDFCSGIQELSFNAPQNTLIGETITFENTSRGYDSYSWKFQGGSPVISEAEMPEVTYERSGAYNVTLYGRSGDLTDSLVATEYIQVDGPEPDPEAVIYPNPTETGGSIHVDFFDDVVTIYIYEITGKLVARYQPQENAVYEAPDRAGFYTIVVETSSESFTQKLIIR